MKRLLAFTLVTLVSVTSGFAQDEKTETKMVPWFDMEHCEICKNMSQHEDMMQHVKWETHLIPNGFLSVAVIPEELAGPMAKAKKEMKATISRIEAGEELHCCGYCQGLGALLEEGATMKELETVAGEITMVTATDPDVVKKIQQHAKRTISEHKKMMEMMKHQEHGTAHKDGEAKHGDHQKSDK